VLGAGIGGLAAARALRMRGHIVQVVEQAHALTEVGAGLQIAPNGLRVLRALGVDPPGPESRAVHLIDGPSGRSLIRMPLGPGFRLVHRADLIAALGAGLDGIPLRLGARVAEVLPRVLRLEDGTEIAAGRIVGADGARGAARGFVAPGHRPRWTGQVAWRAVVPIAEGWPVEAQVHVGPGRHLVLYPLRDGRSLNVVAIEERDDWVAEGWSQQDDPANLRAAFDMYASPIRTLLDRVERVNLWGLMDHGAVPRWTRDGVTLIGDAAHPTLPFLAQGANLALEDAWTLAAQVDDPESWEAERRPRVERALAEAAANARNYHLRGAKRLAAHAALRVLGLSMPRAMLRRYRWLYDHDPTA
jgi:salicylate hydroxylase